ncbi:unnamed protein product [Nyctereutes procyonoides]|uniref:(raccoon dog) hypothetical protein n=1 Tax=Nyctereutes procyonoides TaxID=34880 RepID=A0A811ZR33_NYCPR|nr:unnamed protein product [Nyctereutes procyonoides]
MGQSPESECPIRYKENLGTYNKFTETSFLHCVADHTTNKVKPDGTYLISMRVQEYHIQLNEDLAAKAGLLPNHDKEVLMGGLQRKDCQQLLLWK